MSGGATRRPAPHERLHVERDRKVATPSRGRQALILLAVLLLAANLRVAVASLGVLLPQVQATLQLSDTVTGLLTTVPVWSFAVFGSLTPAVTARCGLSRTATLALGLILVGVATRPFVDSSLAFVVLTALATAGAAFGNVALPALARSYFPHRVPLVSSLLGAALVAGNTAASGTTVPLANRMGGWAPALAAWALLALLALVASLLLQPVRRRQEGHPGRDARPGPATRPGPDTQAPALPVRMLTRSPLAWSMVLLFGCQSATAYAQFGWLPTMLRDAGLSAGHAGWMLAVVTGVSLPLTLLLPLAMRAGGSSPWLPVGFALFSIAGWFGILLAPTTAPWLWAALLGAGSTVFTWVLALLGQKSRTVTGTAALSGFVQGLGYVLATAGPLGAGWLHQQTGSWTVPLLGLIVLAALTGVLGVAVNRPRMLEDDLPTQPVPHPSR